MLQPTTNKIPQYSIKFQGAIDRRYKSGYVHPDKTRFTFFGKPVWITEDFKYVKELVASYNAAAHRNKREAENLYTIVQIDAVEGRNDCHWERTIEFIK